MNELQKCAQILVDSGYVDGTIDYRYSKPWIENRPDSMLHQMIDPFEDTLEGRRQADAIEDWLYLKKGSLLWPASEAATANICQDKDLNSNHKWRLDRIKWCIQELIKS